MTRRPFSGFGAAAIVLGALTAAGCEAPAPVIPPETDTLLAVNGTQLFVRRIGAGEPVLVVHGGPVLDHGYLVEPLRPLADRFELVFYDQRLSGRSAGTVDSASVRLATFVEDMEAIRAALGLGRIHLLGHSWGGLLAMEYATTHPSNLRSLILLSPIPPTTSLWQAEGMAQAAALEPADTAGIGALRSSPGLAAGDPEAIEAMLRLNFRSQFADPGLADSLDFHIPGDYQARSRQFGYLMGDLMGFDLRAGLRRLDVPTLLVYGRSEVGWTLGRDTLVAAIPHTTAVAIPNTGHFPFMERPGEFLRVVRGFLVGVDP